jgi:hypothetical protein
MGKGRKIEYRSFDSAREFCKALKLKNKDEWTRYAKGEMPHKALKPKDIPSRVDKIYKEQGWEGFDDFLGSKNTKDLKKNFRSFEKARALVRNLRLASEDEWKEYIEGKLEDKPKLPADIPPNPEEIYQGKGWLNMSDFLSDHYQPEIVQIMIFEEARTFVHSLKLNSMQEWESYRNDNKNGLPECPEGIPVWPPHAYKDTGWVSWSDWLNLSFGKKI